MKLCVIAPKEGYLAQAGVRIRYQRISGQLESAGHELQIRIIDDLQSAEAFDGDIYVFSKCQDARSQLVARELSRLGKVIGIDLFDDYFSQSGDSRFLRQREWLRTMDCWVDFVLCSTARMRDVASGFLPRAPAHILNDPHETVDMDRIAATAEANLERAMSQKRIDVAWFGNGDNPYFPVGLKDVHAFGHVLHDLRRDGMQVRLRLLTNRRALTVEGLEALGRLPVPWSIDEWTLSGEESLLRDSLIAFIPVTAQPFSIAKSLNRAISALAAGTQVLSPAYPLYQAMHGFIYNDAPTLLTDLRHWRLRLRRETLPSLADRFAEWADPAIEAERLIRFLNSERRRKRSRPALGPQEVRPLGVLHGLRSGADVHQLAQRQRHLSIGSPFSNEKLNYDCRFVRGARPGNVEAELEERTLPLLRPDLLALLQAAVSRNGRTVKRLPLEQVLPDMAGDLARGFSGTRSPVADYAIYDCVMVAAFKIASAMFPGIELLVSEAEAPYGAAVSEFARAALVCDEYAEA